MIDEIPSATSHGLNPDGSVRLGTDSQLVVRFYRRAVLNEFKSKEQGSPQYDPKDFVQIFHPGEKDMIDRPVKDSDKFRFAQQWQIYLAKGEQIVAGTPLDHLFPGNPEIVATLRATRIQTIQQLAGLPDSATNSVQFGAELRKKAQTFLEGTEKGKTFHALERRIEDQQSEIKQLREQLAAVMADLDDPESEGPRRRGRPRNTAAAA